MDSKEFKEFCKGKKIIDKHPVVDMNLYKYLYTEMEAYHDYIYYIGNDGTIYKDSYYIGD